MSGDHEAWVRDQRELQAKAARDEYLQSNPGVGVLNRGGKEIFYRSSPYVEFAPESVIRGGENSLK